MGRAVGVCLVLRGRTDVGAFDVETFSGTARRARRRWLACAAACKKTRIVAPMGIDKAFSQGRTYRVSCVH
eukprot:6709602-Pyramimonas_sp.AAC.1